MFIGLITFGASLSSDCTKCISLYNWPCQTRPILVDINSNKPLYYAFTVSVNKCSGSCNSINDPYARICVLNKVTNTIASVFNLMSEVNETRFLLQHESCECKCETNENVSNLKQKWNRDKCWCDCKQLNNWSSCTKYYSWNPSTCDCEYDEACTISEYLDIKNFSCKKRLFS